VHVRVLALAEHGLVEQTGGLAPSPVAAKPAAQVTAVTDPEVYVHEVVFAEHATQFAPFRP
jgi:hypothetical protein